MPDRRICLVCGEEIRERAFKSGPRWVRIPTRGNTLLTICEHSPNYHHVPDLGPESGHTFRVSVESRGSYAVVGVEGHTDADHFEPLPGVVEVRAWNLNDALHRAAQRPLSAWFPTADTDQQEQS